VVPISCGGNNVCCILQNPKFDYCVRSRLWLDCESDVRNPLSVRSFYDYFFNPQVRLPSRFSIKF
jgi:hypothetical protein